LFIDIGRTAGQAVRPMLLIDRWKRRTFSVAPYFFMRYSINSSILEGDAIVKVGLIRCMQTEDMCPGTTDFKVMKEKKGAFAGVEADAEAAPAKRP